MATGDEDKLLQGGVAGVVLCAGSAGEGAKPRLPGRSKSHSWAGPLALELGVGGQEAWQALSRCSLLRPLVSRALWLARFQNTL